MFTLIIEDKHGGIADEYSFEEGEFYIGRSHTSDIILPSDNVSRRHSRLYTVDGRCYIEDLNSSNGVFVNGRRIHEVYQVQRSAQVKIGDYYLHIESDEAAVEDEERTFCRLSGRNLAFTNQVFRIQRKVNLIGRGKDCTVTVIDPSVSRIHSKLTVERSGALTLEDLKSSNGTFVNDDRVEIATIGHHDIIRIGNVEFLCEVPDAAGQPRPSRDRDSQQAPRTNTGASKRINTGTASASYEEDWGAPRRSNTKWLIASILFGLLAVGGILAGIFWDDITGDKTPAVPSAPITADTVDTGEELRKKAELKKKEELARLIETGTERIKKRQWDLALDSWQQVWEREPLNADARRAINQIKLWKGHKQSLDEARKLASELKRGKAARLLRDINESSVYFDEAQEELKQLMTEKQTLINIAQARLRAKNCSGALEQLNEVQQIDPRDASILNQIEDIKSKLGTRRCRR